MRQRGGLAVLGQRDLDRLIHRGHRKGRGDGLAAHALRVVSLLDHVLRVDPDVEMNAIGADGPQHRAEQLAQTRAEPLVGGLRRVRAGVLGRGNAVDRLRTHDADVLRRGEQPGLVERVAALEVLQQRAEADAGLRGELGDLDLDPRLPGRLGEGGVLEVDRLAGQDLVQVDARRASGSDVERRLDECCRLHLHLDRAGQAAAVRADRTHGNTGGQRVHLCRRGGGQLDLLDRRVVRRSLRAAL